MRALSTDEWLAVWEAGLRQAPVAWVLTLLSMACPDLSNDALAQLSLGERDDRLLILRASLFGSQVVTAAACPECGEQLELAFEVDDIRASSDSRPVEPQMLTVAGWTIRFRMLNSLDLQAISDIDDVEAARSVLYRRSIVAAEQDGEMSTPDRLPASVMEAVAAQLAALDPQAEVQLGLVCPACTRAWEAGFDIVRFLWNELNAWAIRTLRDVHALASAYGWRESDILALSPWRRQLYLQLID